MYCASTDTVILPRGPRNAMGRCLAFRVWYPISVKSMGRIGDMFFRQMQAFAGKCLPPWRAARRNAWLRVFRSDMDAYVGHFREDFAIMRQFYLDMAGRSAGAGQRL